MHVGGERRQRLGARSARYSTVNPPSTRRGFPAITILSQPEMGAHIAECDPIIYIISVIKYKR